MGTAGLYSCSVAAQGPAGCLSEAQTGFDAAYHSPTWDHELERLAGTRHPRSASPKPQRFVVAWQPELNLKAFVSNIGFSVGLDQHATGRHIDTSAQVRKTADEFIEVDVQVSPVF
jgi:hypothetical protein